MDDVAIPGTPLQSVATPGITTVLTIIVPTLNERENIEPLCGHRGVWGRAVAGRTGACAQGGDIPTRADQTRVHTEGQRQTQAAGHLDRRDRVCMTAAMLVLEPIFEADLPPEIYAYRAGRNAQQAAVEVEELLFRGHPEVVDADLADYFGSIPHADLLKSVARRIVDRRVLHLIKMWLECSPLLANLYMRRFVLGWKKLGLERSLGTRLVTYADDLVILCRRQRRSGAAPSARDHGQAEADGERGKDTDLQGAGRGVRLPGFHVRTNVLADDGPSPLGSATLKEEHQAHARQGPCADRPIEDMARDHNAGRRTESCVSRVGQLLQCRLFSPSLSHAR